MTVQVRTESIN